MAPELHQLVDPTTLITNTPVEVEIRVPLMRDEFCTLHVPGHEIAIGRTRKLPLEDRISFHSDEWLFYPGDSTRTDFSHKDRKYDLRLRRHAPIHVDLRLHRHPPVHSDPCTLREYYHQARPDEPRLVTMSEDDSIPVQDRRRIFHVQIEPGYDVRAVSGDGKEHLPTEVSVTDAGAETHWTNQFSKGKMWTQDEQTGKKKMIWKHRVFAAQVPAGTRLWRPFMGVCLMLLRRQLDVKKGVGERETSPESEADGGNEEMDDAGN
ncbi:MAG: hypothetical protein Q9162_001809 [Coniocarpon cinnabarinum]